MLHYSCLTFPALAPLPPLASVMGPPRCQADLSGRCNNRSFCGREKHSEAPGGIVQGRHDGTQRDRLARRRRDPRGWADPRSCRGNRQVVGKQLMGMKLKKLDQRQLWAEAQRRCRLSDEAVRMAKELGIGPRSLIKNIPARTQQWKSPVEDWVRDLYEQRQRKAARKNPGIDAGEVGL